MPCRCFIGILLILCCMTSCHPAALPDSNLSEKEKKERIAGTGNHKNSGGNTMRKYTDDEIRDFALRRGQELWHEPISELVAVLWRGPVRCNRHTLWMIYEGTHSLSGCLIAVDESGNTLYLNDFYGSAEELLRFLKAEDIENRFADNPTVMARIMIDLRYFDLGVLGSLTDLEKLVMKHIVSKDEYRRALRLKSEFFPPRVRRENGFLRMEFWTWCYSMGYLERWKVEFGETDIKFEAEIIDPDSEPVGKPSRIG